VLNASELMPSSLFARQIDGAKLLFMALMLVLFTRIILPLEIIGAPEDDYLVQTRDTGLLGLFYLFCYGLVSLLMLPSILAIFRALLKQPVLLIFLAYVTISVGFANPVSESLPKAIEYGFASALGIYMAQTLSYAQYIRLIRALLLAVALLSLFYVLVMPYGTVASPDGVVSLRGGFQNKNTLGIYGALISLFFGLLSLDGASRHKWFHRFLALLGLIFLVASGAGTSQVSFLAVVMALLMVRALQASPITALVSLAFVVTFTFVAAGLLVWYYDAILAFFGTDRTWTGRLTAMIAIFDVIETNLFFGTHGTNVAMEFIQGVPRGNAHSGHINLLLFYGLTGGVLFFLLFVKMARRAIYFITKSSISLWMIAFFLFILLTNIAEASTEGVVFWAMLIAQSTGAKRWKIQERNAHETA
jgi:O-antigen ligase